MLMKLLAHFVTIVAFGLLGGPALAETTLPHDPSPVELAMLPDYCQARLGSNPQQYQQWNKRMGPDKFIHLHHYCGGLKFMNRYSRALEKQQRRYYLQNAINEFDYVLRNWPDGFSLKADAKTRKTEAEAALRRLDM
jgi:hypothetical protein